MSTSSVAVTRSTQVAKPRTKLSPLVRRRAAWGTFFLMPWIIGFFVFQLLPVIATIIFSFTDYSATKELTWENIHFVGFKNYAHLFSDAVLLPSFGVTLKFALISIPLGLVVPLAFALLVNSKHLKASSIFRTLFFMPSIIPVVAGTMVFQAVLNPQSGWINLMLKFFGIEGPRWFDDPNWAVPALNILGIWAVGNGMIILLAGLQGVPTELYEASVVDGANAVQRFLNITLPMISPVIFYNVTLGLIGAFQYFVPAMLIGGRNGDPQGALLFFPLHFYRQTFVFNEMGYGSVLALILFVIVMIATSLLFWLGQRLVYYAGGDS